MVEKKETEQNLEFLLNSLSYDNLNRIVQRNIFTHDMKKFSLLIKESNFKNNPTYNLILGKIQEGIYKNPTNIIREIKNVKENTSLPNYMSPMELIMYREAINRVANEYSTLNPKTSLEDLYSLARKIGSEVREDFNIYLKKVYNENGELDLDIEKKRKHFFDCTGANINGKDGIIKKFEKTLKLGHYHTLLKKASIRSDELTIDEVPSFLTSFLQKELRKYEAFRKDFVYIVDTLKRENVEESKIKNLFIEYEKVFFNTSYLKDKNIFILKYLLGLNKGIYYCGTLYYFKNELTSLKQLIEQAKQKYTNISDNVINNIKHQLKEKAAEARAKYIKNNIYLHSRPETSRVFLVACLDNLTKEFVNEHKKEKLLIEPENNEFSTKQIQNLPESIFELKKLVKKSINVEKIKINSIKHSPEQLKIEDCFEF